MKLIVCVIFVLNLSTSYFSQEVDSLEGHFSKLVNSTIREGFERIVGGTETTKHAYPYMVYLTTKWKSKTLACGGSLISTTWILTAAHCLFGDQKILLTSMTAWLGIHNVSTNESTKVVAVASRLIPHEYYDPIYLFNDIGLIQLPQPITLNEYIGIVPYAKQRRKNYVKSMGTAVGWGNTWEWELGEEDKSSDILQEATGKIMTSEECALFFATGTITIGIDKICLSGEGPVGACSGDSGGPLLINGTQVGITSVGRGMANTNCILGTPTVFTRVSYHRDWIEYYVEHSNGHFSNFKYSFIKSVLCLVSLFYY